MRCPACLELNSSGVRYCTNCGEDLFVAKPTTEAPKKEVVEEVKSLYTEPETPLYNTAESMASQSTYTTRDTVIPNASNEVYSNTVLASREIRLVAAIIDGVLGSIVAAPLFAAIVMADTMNDDLMALGGMAITFVLGVILLIINVNLLIKNGQTIGKKATKIRVVELGTDRNPGFLHTGIIRIFVPNLINQFLGIFSLIDVLFIFREDRRCIHDLLANTEVIECN